MGKPVGGRSAGRRAATLAAIGGVFAGIAIVSAPMSFAVGALDQEQSQLGSGRVPAGTHGELGVTVVDTPAQTFTAGASGALDQVALHLDFWEIDTQPSAPLTIEIHDTDTNGLPGSTVLASTTIPETATLPGWVAATFATPAKVTSGVKYAIVASSADDVWGWDVGPDGDSYANGAAYHVDLGAWTPWTFDLTFRTYVTPTDADLSVSLTAPATSRIRSSVSYVVTVNNAGPLSADNAVLTDRMPYGVQYSSYTASSGVTCTPPGRNVLTVTCQLGNLASGSSVSATIKVKVTARPAAGVINNVVTVSSDTTDLDATNNSATVATTVTR